MLDARTFSLDAGLTVAEIDSGTDSAWHFLPFEDRRAELTALDERYLLAIGRQGSRSTSVAIFDRFERRRTNIETSDRFNPSSGSDDARSWCYAPAHGSVFVIESTRKRDFLASPNPTQYLRQMSVDGSVNRRILIAPDFSAQVVLPRDDGHLVCVGLNRVAVLDPTSGEVRVSATDLIQWHHLFLRCGILRWFSPDGRWALRPHLGSVIRSGGSPRRGFFSRLRSSSGEAPPTGEEHPDLAGGRAFGIALDLFRLAPVAVERRLIVRYYPEHELDPRTVEILDGLADRQEHSSGNDRGELLMTSHDETPETRLVKALFDQIERIEWDGDSRGFTVSWVQATRQVDVQRPSWARGLNWTAKDLAVRHVSLDGVIGPMAAATEEPNPRELPSEAAIDAINALIRERSSHRIECASWSGADVAAGLREMRRLVEEDGLERLVFGDQLQFRFRVGGRSIGEKRFFETIRAMAAEDAASVLPELRALLRSYGCARARAYRTAAFGPIASGPSNHSPAAMSEAALTLAMLDDTCFDALRDWVVTVDQEHDDFAAAKVFPAVARRTRFATAEAVRFGLWFFLQQWQTVKYEKSYFGLFKAAPEVVAPALFAAAVLEEARDVSGFSDATSVEDGLKSVQAMLGRTFWDRAVSAELNRLIEATRDEG